MFDYEQTLHDCALGNQQALERLYSLESRYLLGVALRIVRERQKAEDVLHDAFINIRNREFGSANGRIEPWPLTDYCWPSG